LKDLRFQISDYKRGNLRMVEWEKMGKGDLSGH